MALRAHFDVDRVRGRAGLERIAAGAHGRELAIHRMKIGLHCELLVLG
jgi:hypothetical protein